MTKLITIDFETFYSKDFSLSKMTTEAYIRSPNFQTIGVGVKINDEEPTWFSDTDDNIRDYLHSLNIPDSKLIAHNMAFDGAILSWRYGLRPSYYIDTLSMAKPVTAATVGGSLKALAKMYQLGTKGTEVVNALGMRREDFGFTQLHEYGEYCKNDCQLTYDLLHKLIPESTKKEMYIIDLMLRMYTDPVLELDKSVLAEHLTVVQERKEKLMSRLDASIGRDALMSNPQFAEVLTKLGVQPPMKISPATGKEAYAFSKTDVAFKALLEHENLYIQSVVSARLGIKSTLEETRTESFLGIAERGALPIMLTYYGAHTGRASGGDKVNLQNLPRGGELRKSIRAPKGHKIVAVDSAQIEARVVAWLAGETELVENFAKGEDIYSKFATEVYEKPVTKADKVERFVGKTCILGLGYGMGKDKFKSTLKIGQAGVSVDLPIEDCDRVVTLYRAKYSSIPALWKQGQKALAEMVAGRAGEFGTGIKLGYDQAGIRLPNGMLMRYKNLRKEDDQYVYDTRYGPNKIYGGKLIENVVQALARIVVFDQMAKIDQHLRKKDHTDGRYKVALTVHDEVVVVVPESYKNDVEALMLEIMSSAPSWAQGLPVACEGASGDNYADCK